MVSILERIRRRGGGGDEAQQVLSQFTEKTEPLRVEIEATPFWFYASPLLRSGAVVISMPQHLQPAVSSGNWMRIRVSDEERKDLRLQISSAKHGGSAHMALTPDQIAVLCKLPGAAIVPSKRSADRMNTSNYHDLILDVSSPPGSYPIVNLSKGGVKIRLADEAQKERFPLGKYMEKGAIRLGKKARVPVLDMVPRCHYEDGVGLELVINPQGNARRILDMFLDHVQHKERELQTAAAAPTPAAAE
jgi:hypothetical protein